MIDHISVRNLSVSPGLLLSNPLLYFPDHVDEDTHERILYLSRKAKHNGLEFSMRPRGNGDEDYSCKLTGSLHKFKNRGLHNADNFTCEELLYVLDALWTLFEVNPCETQLNGFEFGVNIVVPFKVVNFLRNIVHYKWKPFQTTDGETCLICSLTNYEIKIYDKVEQCRRILKGFSDNLLRVEVKVKRMKYLTNNSIQICTLADLLEKNVQEQLGELLISIFSDIIIDDVNIDSSMLNEKERLRLLEGQNLRQWRYPDRNDFDTQIAYTSACRAVKRKLECYQNLVSRCRTSCDCQKVVIDLIKGKWQELSHRTTWLNDRILIAKKSWNVKSCVVDI